MKVAIIHDWFDEIGGAEKVVQSFLRLYPEADIFSLVDFFSDNLRAEYLNGKFSRTSFIQKLPFARKQFRNYLPFFSIAIEQFDLSSYDLVLSSSHAVAKGVLTGPDQLHCCYQYSPIRYAWDMYHPYFKEHNIKGIKAFILRIVLYKMRIWDAISSNRVDYFIAISSLVQNRIRKFYRRDSTLIFPPVDTTKFSLNLEKDDYYFTASRLVPYKKVKLIVEAFNVSGKPLYVAGIGPQYEEIKKIAKKNVKVIGFCSDDEMKQYMQKAKAFVYAAYEDFGIVPVEAMSCGTPVIAYGKGGVKDTVIDEETGLFFDQQNIESINKTVDKFEMLSFDYAKIAAHANKFDTKLFEKNLSIFLNQKMKHKAEVSCSQ